MIHAFMNLVRLLIINNFLHGNKVKTFMTFGLFVCLKCKYFFYSHLKLNKSWYLQHHSYIKYRFLGTLYFLPISIVITSSKSCLYKNSSFLLSVFVHRSLSFQSSSGKEERFMKCVYIPSMISWFI